MRGEQILFTTFDVRQVEISVVNLWSLVRGQRGGLLIKKQPIYGIRYTDFCGNPSQ